MFGSNYIYYGSLDRIGDKMNKSEKKDLEQVRKYIVDAVMALRKHYPETTGTQHIDQLLQNAHGILWGMGIQATILE